MTRPRLRHLGTAALCAALLAVSSIGSAQASGAKLSSAEISALAALHLSISAVHDSIDAELAQSKNKTNAAQKELQDKLRTQISALIAKAGISDAEYQRRRYVVSTDNDARKEFDATISKLTGAPLPGTTPAAAAPATVAVPAGPVGVHLGHIVNAFPDNPDRMGFLPLAMAEARTAQQHAELGMRNPGNLEALKLHAGHVLHALDPTIVTTGPARGYGLKRAAAGIADHVELAAKAEGASQAVGLHAPHVATAARATATRADQAIALARQIREATAADAAASLMGQLVSLCGQLITGVDANADGRITWDAREGGLQQAQEHVNFMLR